MWRLPTTVLPDGIADQLWVSGGALTRTPVDGAETLPGRFVLPGLVDSHAHLTLQESDEHIYVLGDRTHRDAVLESSRRSGVLLLRDVGGDPSLTLPLARDESSGVLAAGRFLASDGHYFPTLHTPVDAESLAAAAVEQIRAGAQWVKLVGDFPYRMEKGVDATPSYDIDTIRTMVDAVHAAGGRVATHTATAYVGDLVAAGIDSVEHGYGLDANTVRAMASSGCAWTPTLCAGLFLPPNAPPERVKRRADRIELFRTLLPLAVSLGVPVLSGTDVAGTIADEVGWLVHCGLSPLDALRSASVVARTFLDRPALVDGRPADLVTFDADPREDPAVLAKPAAVLRRGERIT
ncbi:amidohydrolase family protein [Fodinicola acaciae]|uniref:amidohydrolase family protein n=1 Tax=Fodinicola acaciae TaxID=2681555 RepID=UPI0013D1E17E|nr:amidohydrolase family protein [Fodinicola acaciae]